LIAGSTFEWLSIVGLIAFGLALPAFYYAEVLNLSYVRALFKTAIATALVYIVVGLPIAFVVAIPILARGEPDHTLGSSQ